MGNKYNNKIIKTKDGKFDSKKEYNIWKKLKRKQEMGEISNLQRQVPFVLIPTQYDYVLNSKNKTTKKVVERECKYIADFTYVDNSTSEFVVGDAKGGILTPEFIIKRKLMLWVHKIKIKILR